ncbi:MAG: hypothetical protein AABX65_04750, partial [Nanoarchaeota archaeon]
AEETPQTQQETQTSPEPEAPASADYSVSVPESAGVGITGAVTGLVSLDIESQGNIISGSVSADAPFSYTLEEGESLRIISGSVKAGDKQLSDNVLNLVAEGNNAKITTDYNETSIAGASVLNINLGEFGIKASEGELKVEIVYNGQSLARVVKEIVLSEIAEVPKVEENKTMEKSADKILPDRNFSAVLAENLTKVGNLNIENVTLELNGSVVRISTQRQRVIVGKPVKWVKQISVETPEVVENVTLVVPAAAENISVKAVGNVVSSVEGVESGNVSMPVAVEMPIVTDSVTGAVTASFDKQENSLVSAVFRSVGNFFLRVARVTGFVISNEPESAGEKEVNIDVESNTTNYEIEYTTPGPEAFEEETDFGKRVVVSAPDELGYTDVLTYTSIDKKIRSPDSVKVYWIVDNVRVEHQFDAFDNDENGYIERIEWATPHLSNQTFEVTIQVLNVQSYPPLGGNWTVRFNTTGVANLTISASNGTTYPEFYLDSNFTTQDILPSELRCGDNVLWSRNPAFSAENVRFVDFDGVERKIEESLDKSYSLAGIKVIDYFCNETANHTVIELTTGKHYQKFTFGYEEAYAY